MGKGGYGYVIPTFVSLPMSIETIVKKDTRPFLGKRENTYLLAWINKISSLK
jgi:hypothetical protein